MDHSIDYRLVRPMTQIIGMDDVCPFPFLNQLKELSVFFIFPTDMVPQCRHLYPA
jgi:hypothetical protein